MNFTDTAPEKAKARAVSKVGNLNKTTATFQLNLQIF